MRHLIFSSLLCQLRTVPLKQLALMVLVCSLIIPHVHSETLSQSIEFDCQLCQNFSNEPENNEVALINVTATYSYLVSANQTPEIEHTYFLIPPLRAPPL